MANKALILLDFINEIVNEKGKFAGKGYPAFLSEHKTLENVQTAISKARENEIPVIFVNISFAEDYSDWPENSPLFGTAKKFEALKRGTWATEIHPSLNKQDHDMVLTKKRVSAFFETSLEEVLKDKDVDTILLGGVATDLVVQTTARDGHDRDLNVVILEDLCGAANEDDHITSLKLLSKVAKISDSTTELG